MSRQETINIMRTALSRKEHIKNILEGEPVLIVLSVLGDLMEETLNFLKAEDPELYDAAKKHFLKYFGEKFRDSSK